MLENQAEAFNVIRKNDRMVYETSMRNANRIITFLGSALVTVATMKAVLG